MLPEGALEQIRLGASQEQVLIVLGTPSTVATVSGEAFYYISQRRRGRFVHADEDHRSARGRDLFRQRQEVQRVAKYGIRDGKVFDFVSRTTPTAGSEPASSSNSSRQSRTSHSRCRSDRTADFGKAGLSGSEPVGMPRGACRIPLRASMLAPTEPRWRRRGVLHLADQRCAQCANTASSSSATMLVILIIGLTAGPAVSL